MHDDELVLVVELGECLAQRVIPVELDLARADVLPHEMVDEFGDRRGLLRLCEDVIQGLHAFALVHHLPRTPVEFLLEELEGDLAGSVFRELFKVRRVFAFEEVGIRLNARHARREDPADDVRVVRDAVGLAPEIGERPAHVRLADDLRVSNPTHRHPQDAREDRTHYLADVLVVHGLLVDHAGHKIPHRRIVEHGAADHLPGLRLRLDSLDPVDLLPVLRLIDLGHLEELLGTLTEHTHERPLVQTVYDTALARLGTPVQGVRILARLIRLFRDPGHIEFRRLHGWRRAGRVLRMQHRVAGLAGALAERPRTSG